MSREYQLIADGLATDMLPYISGSWRDAFGTLSENDQLVVLKQVEYKSLDTVSMMMEHTEMTYHFLLMRDEYVDCRVWQLLDGLRLIHHPGIYAKVFFFRGEMLGEIFSLLTPNEIDALMTSDLPIPVQNQISSYMWRGMI